MRVDIADHLSTHKRVQLGGYYTPKKLVDKVYDFIKPYRSSTGKNVIIFDSAGGCGAFLTDIGESDYRIADCDFEAFQLLKKNFNKNKVFYVNSLVDVSREKYRISSNAFLIMIGNPPYNDTTSEFRNGEKGKNECDEDLFDRDLGISFLKSYNKLNADVVCILHPLSYLIKETNFKRLRDFKDNYKLIRGDIFSSELFFGTGSSKFPIMVSLYERNEEGMTYDYIRNFQFSILHSNKTFTLSKYTTTDGYINKYPPRKKDIQISPIGLYYYTFRDLNSLRKNTSFLSKKHYNGIIVTLENFYKYAYLYALKTLFNPKDAWIYGNLSPLVDIAELENKKKLFIKYTLKSNRIFQEVNRSIVRKIEDFYKIKSNNTINLEKLEENISNKLNKLI
jgi:hypothetical protein